MLQLQLAVAEGGWLQLDHSLQVESELQNMFLFMIHGTPVSRGKHYKKPPEFKLQ